MAPNAQAGAISAEKIEQTRAEAARRFAEKPAAAFEWALGQGDMQRIALEVVLSAWAGADPSSAVGALRALTGEQWMSARAFGFDVVIGKLAATNPAAAWDAAETMPPGIEAASAKMRVLEMWSAQDAPAAAGRLKALTAAGRSAEDQRMLQGSYATTGGRFASQDGPKAAEWAASLPVGSPEQVSAVGGVVSGWYAKDPKAVTDWLNAMKEGVVHDTAAATLSALSVATAPEVAMEWAQAISDKRQRESVVANVLARWSGSEPDKAEAWLARTESLSAEQRQSLLETNRLIRSVTPPASKK